MGVLVYVLGRTGTGKSYSMKNFPKRNFAVINVQGKILPFRGAGEIETTNTDDSSKVIKALEIYAEKFKSIVIDDFQYLMSNEFMRRAYEGSWDKFTEIARHAWDIPDKVRELPSDVIVYIMCHTDKDAEGTERLKTIGKLLDEKIYLEGMSTIVLKTVVSDGHYTFVTQNNGKDTVKSPEDMFPAYAIDNDLYYVDQKIREYYGLGNTMTKEELNAADEAVAHEEITKPEPKKRNHAKEEKEEKPTRHRRSEDPEIKAVNERNMEAIVNNGITGDPNQNEEVPFDEIQPPQLEEIPKRKRKNRAVETEQEEIPEKVEPNSGEVTEQPTRRRRRRA